jgi:hypothetical protein
MAERAAFNRRVLRSLLEEVYKPEGIEIWMTAKHRAWGLTVDEMIAAGRGEEVMQMADMLASGAYA